MSDQDLIRRGDAKAACQKIADEAKGYGIPQMTMGANTCRDALDALPAVTSDREARLVAAYRIEAMRRPEYTHEAFDAHIAALKGDKP